ncbi:MAG TPA: hypothetical protein VLV87_09090 [Gammaproteobacteria bacterium]|nr:hypothetical protein [Gammaproteobacteria bacterium]
MSTGPAKAPAFLAPLEGMRGVAAAGVVPYHARLLEHRYIQRLGKWSYSIYMVHFALILVPSDLARLRWKRGPSESKRWVAKRWGKQGAWVPDASIGAP